ncbi:hypothetical protein HDU87_000859 [Geranomyces variabilis]|uniref:Uncharacterized protein n=1 Tax=Geranomyces variabilis TaxID=109894 RepID=A0AAD5TE66_9FUNG|nr:hypothetical protein HDU87_000859 [Geranomyces variabilis]
MKLNDGLINDDLHAAVGDAVSARTAEALDGSNPFTPEQAAGAQLYFGHMQKSINARKNRFQLNVAPGPGNIDVAASEKVAACEKLEPQRETRFAVGNLGRKRSIRRRGCSRGVCNRARGKVLKPSTVTRSPRQRA